MEGQKTEAGHQKQCGDQKTEKEKNLLFPCPGLSAARNEEGLWGME